MGESTHVADPVSCKTATHELSIFSVGLCTCERGSASILRTTYFSRLEY